MKMHLEKNTKSQFDLKNADASYFGGASAFFILAL
tara:strand:- start:677 stop:781 length:105 start_codon:yes stop_codon:yes gene_type:complete